MTTRLAINTLAAVATLLPVAGVAPRNVGSAETEASRSVDDAHDLAAPEELDVLSLSRIDQKLVLSLAVEMQLQVTLGEAAIERIHDDGLKRFAADKLRLYRALFATLDELSNGRAAALLAGGRATADAKRESKHKTGGLKGIVSRLSDAAILQMRLDIAGEYSELLGTELEAGRPQDFDRRYLSTECVNQMQVVAMLRVFEERASDGLARIIHRATTAAEQHLEQGRLHSRRLELARADTTARGGLAVTSD
jgi:hypothetical protein